jgi:hypothetical protein
MGFIRALYTLNHRMSRPTCRPEVRSRRFGPGHESDKYSVAQIRSCVEPYVPRVRPERRRAPAQLTCCANVQPASPPNLSIVLMLESCKFDLISPKDLTLVSPFKYFLSFLTNISILRNKQFQHHLTQMPIC